MKHGYALGCTASFYNKSITNLNAEPFTARCFRKGLLIICTPDRDRTDKNIFCSSDFKSDAFTISPPKHSPPQPVRRSKPLILKYHDLHTIQPRGLYSSFSFGVTFVPLSVRSMINVFPFTTISVLHPSGSDAKN